MTDGEKMVWAAFYAANYQKELSNPPPYVVLDSGKWEEWENMKIAGVIEGATYAVERMRKMLPRVKKDLGERYCEMLKAMLEKR